MNVVEIEKLVKKFGDFVAVNGINLKIKEGEIYGLLGPNGAGKSTTINMICGLLSVSNGSIAVMEKDIKKYSNFAKQNIGVVPQDIAIYEDLTSYENVKFFGSLYGLKGDELKTRVNETLEFVGLTDKAKSKPGDFSGGMKRRLNIACAIVHRPKVIIMDEPTVGIDPQSRNHILKSVKTLNKMGSTIIYTSHYMEEVEEICTRIAIVDHGQIVAEGTKDELKSIITDTNTIIIVPNSMVDIDKEAISAIGGVKNVEIGDNKIKIDSLKEISNLDKIIQYFINNNIGIKSVESKIPDLETVFLTLTGRKLRD